MPPGEYAGNMDIRDLVEGTTLYVPVHVPGALLWTGDSHAGQGNGEVNLTAIETAYREFNITVDVIKGKPLDFPRIETPKSWITMGFDQDLNKAWDQAKAQTVKFLAEQRNDLGRSGGEADGQRSPTAASRRSSTSRRASTASIRRTSAGQRGHGAPDQGDARYYVTHVKDADLNKAMDDASMAMIKFLEKNGRSRGSTPMGSRAWRWTAASAPSRTPRRTSTA